MRAVGRFLANSLGYVASEHDYVGARPFAREESESAKGPFKPQGGLLQGNRSAESEKKAPANISEGRQKTKEGPA